MGKQIHPRVRYEPKKYPEIGLTILAEVEDHPGYDYYAERWRYEVRHHCCRDTALLVHKTIRDRFRDLEKGNKAEGEFLCVACSLLAKGTPELVEQIRDRRNEREADERRRNVPEDPLAGWVPPPSVRG